MTKAVNNKLQVSWREYCSPSGLESILKFQVGWREEETCKNKEDVAFVTSALRTWAAEMGNEYAVGVDDDGDDNDDDDDNEEKVDNNIRRSGWWIQLMTTKMMLTYDWTFMKAMRVLIFLKSIESVFNTSTFTARWKMENLDFLR